jgi:hypothetical protein
MICIRTKPSSIEDATSLEGMIGFVCKEYIHVCSKEKDERERTTHTKTNKTNTHTLIPRIFPSPLIGRKTVLLFFIRLREKEEKKGSARRIYQSKECIRFFLFLICCSFKKSLLFVCLFVCFSFSKKSI